MEENFCIAAFRSRQQVMAFERAMRLLGASPSVITTPRAVSLGCGLSVRFPASDLDKARQAYRHMPPGNLVGFYRISPAPDGRSVLHPIPSAAR